MKSIMITYNDRASDHYAETINVGLDFECKDGFFILKLIDKLKESRKLILFPSHCIEAVIVKEDD